MLPPSCLCITHIAFITRRFSNSAYVQRLIAVSPSEQRADPSRTLFLLLLRVGVGSSDASYKRQANGGDSVAPICRLPWKRSQWWKVSDPCAKEVVRKNDNPHESS